MIATQKQLPVENVKEKESKALLKSDRSYSSLTTDDTPRKAAPMPVINTDAIESRLEKF